jgi:type III secretion system OrgA/MxiK family protein
MNPRSGNAMNLPGNNAMTSRKSNGVKTRALSTSGHGRFAEQLLRVMYDPLAYASSTSCEAEDTMDWIAWQNRQLIERHHLICRIDFTIDAELGWWLEHWASLRRIAFLIGCRCLRDTLAAERRLLHLDSLARQFALLPIVAPHVNSKRLCGRGADDLALHAQGFYVLESLASGLPDALRQRLALIFHDVEERVHDFATTVESTFYPMLISTATRYAQAHPY